MLSRICIGGTGVALCIIGTAGLDQGGFYSRFYGNYISFGNHPELTGALVIAVGFLLIAQALRKRGTTTSSTSGSSQ